MNLAVDTREFRYAKGKVWQRFVYFGAVLAFAVLAIYRTAEGERRGGGAWFAAVVLAFLGLYAFRGLYDRRPMLLLSEAGVWFRGWRLERAIPWGDISEVRYVPAARGEPFITLELADSAPHSRRHRELQFRTGVLDIANEEALRLVKEYWSAAKQARGGEV